MSTHNAIQVLAAHLSTSRAVVGAVLKYDALSDALYWSDEVPDVLELPDECLILLKDIQYRRTLVVLGSSSDVGETVQQFRSLCPTWPGFAEERWEARPEYVQYHAAARARFLSWLENAPDNWPEALGE